jgi:hypothetical protein
MFVQKNRGGNINQYYCITGNKIQEKERNKENAKENDVLGKIKEKVKLFL